MHDPKTVVKVGGSLFDWSELGQRLGQWLDSHASKKILLVPGGGPTVDLIRNFDRWHGLGEEAAHWLALRTLTVNAHFLATILTTSYSSKPVVIADLQETHAVWAQHGIPILDPFPFAQIDEHQPGREPDARADEGQHRQHVGQLPARHADIEPEPGEERGLLLEGLQPVVEGGRAAADGRIGIGHERGLAMIGRI